MWESSIKDGYTTEECELEVVYPDGFQKPPPDNVGPALGDHTTSKQSVLDEWHTGLSTTRWEPAHTKSWDPDPSFRDFVHTSRQKMESWEQNGVVPEPPPPSSPLATKITSVVWPPWNEPQPSQPDTPIDKTNRTCVEKPTTTSSGESRAPEQNKPTSLPVAAVPTDAADATAQHDEENEVPVEVRSEKQMQRDKFSRTTLRHHHHSRRRDEEFFHPQKSRPLELVRTQQGSMFVRSNPDLQRRVQLYYDQQVSRVPYFEVSDCRKADVIARALAVVNDTFYVHFIEPPTQPRRKPCNVTDTCVWMLWAFLVCIIAVYITHNILLRDTLRSGPFG